MSKIWMLTAPFEKGSLKTIAEMYRKFDGKRYQFGIERGRGGYRHIQGRIEYSAKTDYEIEVRKGRKTKKEKRDLFFDTASKTKCYLEESEQWSNYEGKDGKFITSEDTPEIRAQRFAPLTDPQRGALACLESTNDRQVVVWYDKSGNSGKSFLTGAMWERGKAHYVRLVGSNAEGIIKDTASKMAKDRRDMVIIDIPRARKWSTDLYEAIEVIKDGLIDDPRYTSQSVNIRGVKVLVMANSKPNERGLSKDRWVFYSAPCGATKTKEDTDRGLYT